MTKLKRPDFLEYFTDATGTTHIANVFCKSCGEKIQHGHLMKNHIGVTVPVLAPLPNYVDLYISFVDENGTLRRKSTPMCATCASGDFSTDILSDIYDADIKIMEERVAHSGNNDQDVTAHINKRKGAKIVGKIGHCVPGYAIVGEGR